MANIGKIILLLPIIFMHITNILLILLKNNLHKSRYYLLANLSFSDVIMVLIVLIKSMSGNSEEYMDIIPHVCFYSSIITTVVISVDRYIAIAWCLRYEQIVTNKNLAIVTITSWCVSLAFGLIPTIEDAKVWKGNIHYRTGAEICRSVVSFTCCAALVFLSIVLLRIRRNHIKAIALRKSDFPSRKRS